MLISIDKYTYKIVDVRDNSLIIKNMDTLAVSIISHSSMDIFIRNHSYNAVLLSVYRDNLVWNKKRPR